MELIHHFRLSGVGIHLLIYCQMVTRSVVSAVGAGRGRQAGDISLVLRGAGSGWWGRARGGRKEPALDGSSCVSLPHCRKDWSTTLPRHRVPHRCQIYCFWQQANTFMSHLSSYHFFPRVFLSPLWNNRFFPSFSNPALAVCFQAAVRATCSCSSIAAQ